jgi:hypothetical protein
MKVPQLRREMILTRWQKQTRPSLTLLGKIILNKFSKIPERGFLFYY